MINLNNVNKFIPYKHFKMEGLHCLKFLVEQDDLLCKKNLKEAHLPVLLNKNSQKFARFQWSDNIYEFLSLCFGLGPALSFFTELSKVTIVLLRLVNIRIIFYLDGMLLTGRTLPEILMARDTDFSIATFGFCDQPQKISPASYETNRVSGEKMTCFFREKIKTCFKMSGDFQATKNFSLKSHKVNWHVINCPGHFNSSNPVSISLKGANISSKEKRVLQRSCDIGGFSQRETFSKIQQREPHMIIQTDALTKCWGHTAREFRQGGNGQRRISIFTYMF